MTLRNVSVIWSILHVLLIFVVLYESRYSRRKTWTLTLCFMGPLLAANIALYLICGLETLGQVLLLTMTLPSLVFFFILARHRDGRFFFTFCLADTISYEIILATYFLDAVLPWDSDILLFLLRLVAFPALEVALIKWMKGPYIALQQIVHQGWAGFTAITALFYVLLFAMSAYPTIITERPQYWPQTIMVMLLMPLMYQCIFNVLIQQQALSNSREHEQLLQMQSSALRKRVEQTAHSEEQLAIQRHDLRHRFQTLDAFLEKGEIQAARDYIAAATHALDETRAQRWCLNPVLDAVFVSYFRQAASYGIRIEADIDIPEELPVDASELSTVFANALENAIHAVAQLPTEQRVIQCRCIQHPQLMFRVSNPCQGRVALDEAGIPFSAGRGHGLGTRSIAAYCEKYGAFCDYTAEEGRFTVQIIQPERPAPL